MEQNNWSNLKYNVGFGNHFESEAEEGALVKGRNNPQKAPMGLYAEQLSGTPFTFSKHKNQRSWLYRILPTCKHASWSDVSKDFEEWVSDFSHDHEFVTTPEQRRWTPQAYLDCHFAAGIRTMMGAGCPQMKDGLSIHYYSFKQQMHAKRLAMYSADADMLIVPQEGTLLV